MSIDFIQFVRLKIISYFTVSYRISTPLALGTSNGMHKK